MKKAIYFLLAWLTVLITAVWSWGSGICEDKIIESKGSWLIDGYNLKEGDRSPQGTLYYNVAKNEFIGTYVGLKLPTDRQELHVWLYDTVNKKSIHLGKVPYLPDTIGKSKGEFVIKNSDAFKNGNFGSFELIVFSAEVPGSNPKEPSGSMWNPKHKPAFYLFGRLPGTNSPKHYCGHGEDFFFAKNLDHTCYD